VAQMLNEPIACLSPLMNKLMICAACNIAMRFCAPVYVVGSSIIYDNPLDIDIILVVSEKQFKNLIGTTGEINTAYINNEPSPAYLRWARFTMKQKRYFEERVSEWDIDFKITTRKQFFKVQGRKIRLDVFKSIF